MDPTSGPRDEQVQSRVRGRRAGMAVCLASKKTNPGRSGEVTGGPARGGETIPSLRKKKKTCAEQAGTRDVGDNCGGHNCRHSQVHISSASTDVITHTHTHTHVDQASGPGLMIKNHYHALLIPLS